MSQPQSTNSRAFPIFIVATNDEARADAQHSNFEPRAEETDSTAWVNDRLNECYND